jgi:tetratricopeptide (TPR) repeat protein
MDLFQNQPIELVPSYLILGEASIGMKHFDEAEDYLSLAKWAILKSKSCDDTIKSKLHRNFGQLYASQKQYDKALNQFSLNVYYSCLVHNPKHIAVTGGYYKIGTIFHQKSYLVETAAFYDKILQIWQESWTPEMELDVAQGAEAVQMFEDIIKFKEQATPTATNIKNCKYTFATVLFSSGNIERSKKEAYLVLESILLLILAFEESLGREHSTTIEVRNFIKRHLQ